MTAVFADEQIHNEPGAIVPASTTSPATPSAHGSLAAFPARAVAASWPTTRCDRSEVLELVASAPFALPSSWMRGSCRRGLFLLLDWLEDQPGQSWQERWLATGADPAGDGWAQVPAQWLEQNNKCSPSRLILMTSALLVVVGADVVRPSLN